MSVRRSLATQFVAVIVLCYLSLAVETVTVRGRLRNYGYNTKCLSQMGQNNGAELKVVDCSDSNANQIIEANGFKNLESEAAYIQFDLGGKCLSLNGFSSDNNVPVLMWDCSGQDNQKWSIVNGNAEGSFQLKLKSTGKCLTADTDGTWIDQYDCYGTTAAPHQSWTLDVMESQPNDVTYRGVLRNYGFNTKCLHAKGDGNGAELEIVDCSGPNTDQLIKMDSFQNIENEAAYVQFDVSGKCLSLNGFSSDNGVHILIWDCVNQDNQKWKIINGDKEDSFQLQLKSTGKCLTAESGGTFLDQYECYAIDTSPHQWWTIDTYQSGEKNPEMVPYSFYQLENVDKPDKCLRYKDGTASSYALELAPCDRDDLSQQMVAFTDFSDDLGYSGFRFQTTGKCLDVSGESNTNGAAVGQYNCVNQANQKWRMESFDFGTFRIRSELGEKCLTSEGGGTYMDIYDCYSKFDAPHQYWKQRNPNIKKSSGGKKIHLLQNFKFPDKCLHSVGSSNENGAALELIDCDSIKPEESINSNEWLNYDTAAGYVKFNGKCLSMSGFDSDNGVKIIQWDCADQDNQRWQIVNGDIDTSFQLKSEKSSKCLTAEGDGTYMDQWDCLGTDAAPHQSWMIKAAPDGALLEAVDYPGKCFSVTGTDSSEIILAECDEFDENQLFDHSDLLNYNSRPGLLKNLGTNKCLRITADGHVKQAECDVGDLDELWFVVLGTLFGTFKLKASQSPKCLTAEADGSYTDLTDCFTVSDSRRKRDLSPKALLRLSYKMAKPNGNQRYLIRNGYFSGYCLTRDGAGGWTNSKVGIESCNQNDERQQWHFESVGSYFQNKFNVRNGPLCLRSKGTTNGSLIDYESDCQATDEFTFKFTAYGEKVCSDARLYSRTYRALWKSFRVNLRRVEPIEIQTMLELNGDCLFSLQNMGSGQCMKIEWYKDQSEYYIDYINQIQCGQLGSTAWTANPIRGPEDDWKCGPEYGGKFCTGSYTGMCCSKYGRCGPGIEHCEKTICQSNYGPCFKSLRDMPDLDMRCGPWIAAHASRNGLCQGKYAGPGYCCSTYGVCGNEPQPCYADNCDPEYGSCPEYPGDPLEDKCGPYWGNKTCSGRHNEQCCSKFREFSGTCGSSDNHCTGSSCDPGYGACPDRNKCGYLNNSKRLCRAGECCHGTLRTCGTSEKFCGQDCDVQVAYRRKANTKSVGLKPEQYGVCRTSTCSYEGEPCTVRGLCCRGLKCVVDPDNSRKKKCVLAPRKYLLVGIL